MTIDWRNDDIAMRNRFGAIITDMLKRVDGGLATTGWNKAAGPTHLGPPDYVRGDETKQRWIRYAAFVIDWV